MGHDITYPWNTPSSLHRNAHRNGIRRSDRKPISDPVLGPPNATVLLPLRPCDAVHKNVRVAAIRESLVGDFMPQEELCLEKSEHDNVESAVT